MRNFNHPNVLTLIGVCIDGGPAPYIVMPFMSNGSLLSYLKKERFNLVVTEGADEDVVSPKSHYTCVGVLLRNFISKYRFSAHLRE